jgi:hypothetical protein
MRRIYYRPSAAALELVDVSGRALLDWVQQALTLSPGFVQVSAWVLRVLTARARARSSPRSRGARLRGRGEAGAGEYPEYVGCAGGGKRARESTRSTLRAGPSRSAP